MQKRSSIPSIELGDVVLDTRRHCDGVTSREPGALHDLVGHGLSSCGLREVDDDHQRLAGEQPELAQHRPLLEGQRHRPHRPALVEALLDATQERDQLGLLLLLQARALLGALQTLGDGLEVGELELELENVDVANRVDATLDVRDVGILERANHERRRISLADVSEEAVAQSLAAARAAHQPGNVGECDRGRDHLGRLEQRGKPIEARIGDRHDSRVRFDGERVVADRAQACVTSI